MTTSASSPAFKASPNSGMDISSSSSRAATDGIASRLTLSSASPVTPFTSVYSCSLSSSTTDTSCTRTDALRELVVDHGGHKVTMVLQDTCHLPNCRNLLSHSQAEDQGYSVEYHGRSGQKKFELWREEEMILEVGRNQHGLYTFNSQNDFLTTETPQTRPVKESSPAKTPKANISAADGAANLQTWHERLGHLCPRFVKTMVDQGLVKGMMLRQRIYNDCEACHLGKERKPPAKKNIDREITRKNEVIFADLLFPERDEPVLVIVDGYTRFTTVYPLKTKSAPEVNVEMIRYIEWAERQHPKCKVNKVITDRGGEFENAEMKLWYQSRGIEFLPNPLRSSHLNPCERVWRSGITKIADVIQACRLGARTADCRRGYSVDRVRSPSSFLTLCTRRLGGLRSSRWTREDVSGDLGRVGSWTAPSGVQG
jgi:hypothetical protein